MKWLNVLGIWLMAIPEFVVILYAIGHINAFLSRNSGSCGVGCLGDLVVFFEIAFFGSILISLIWTVIFLKKDDERRKNTCPSRQLPTTLKE